MSYEKYCCFGYHERYCSVQDAGSGDDAKKAITIWLDAKFESGRHQRRIDKISKAEK